MSWIRTGLVILVAIPVTAVLAGWVLLSALFRLPWAGRHCKPASRLWARILLRTSGVTVRFEGLEKIDWDEPHIVVANHQSWFDVFALSGHLPARYRFAAKEELGRIPLFGPAWKVCGHISVARGDRSRAIESLNRAGAQVRSDRLTVVMFPEGTRSPDGRLQPFHKGAFVLGIQTGVDLVPVGISGSRAIMPKGSFLVRPGEVVIRIGDPIRSSRWTMRQRNQLRDLAHQKVLELMDDPGAHLGEDTEAVPDDTPADSPDLASGESDPPSTHHEAPR